ncbi:MAG: hypothetical protein JKY00_07935 [Roseicyclus sp.]|nr:hypothetical protein [Roseicyclus sp.]
MTESQGCPNHQTAPTAEQRFPYHCAVLSVPDLGVARAPGPGLGNLLFPIARALVGQQAMGGTFVFPTMRQVKIGPYLRFERDKRTYGDTLRRRSPGETATWVKAAFLPKTGEGAATRSAKAIAYAGMADQFHSLPDDPSLIRDFLLRASRRPMAKQSYDIAIHFRKGDFAAPAQGHSGQSVQLPIEWYRAAYTKARDWLGKDNPSVVLFTDADPPATAAELGIEAVQFEPPGNALTSLVAMSRAKVLIPSRSTFSLWAQYLGQSTTFWPEGFDLQTYKRVDPVVDLVV